MSAIVVMVVAAWAMKSAYDLVCFVGFVGALIVGFCSGFCSGFRQGVRDELLVCRSVSP